MALIFSPLSEDILQGPYRPLPRSAFLMMQLGGSVTKAEQDILDVIKLVLDHKQFKAIDASEIRSQKDFLVKIIQTIRGSGFGIAIFSEVTPSKTLANIFFEVAICNLLGKPTILVKTERAEVPSDFVRTEWVAYIGSDKGRLREEFSKAVTSIEELAEYYDVLGDIAMGAAQIDPELAFERYKQSILITHKAATVQKIQVLLSKLANDGAIDFNGRPKQNFHDSLSEFTRLLPPVA